MNASLANALRLIEAEYIAYTNLTPDKQAALAQLVANAGFAEWWREAGRGFDPGLRRRVDTLLNPCGNSVHSACKRHE